MCEILPRVLGEYAQALSAAAGLSRRSESRALLKLATAVGSEALRLTEASKAADAAQKLEACVLLGRLLASRAQAAWELSGAADGAGELEAIAAEVTNLFNQAIGEGYSAALRLRPSDPRPQAGAADAWLGIARARHALAERASEAGRAVEEAVAEGRQGRQGVAWQQGMVDALERALGLYERLVGERTGEARWESAAEQARNRGLLPPAWRQSTQINYARALALARREKECARVLAVCVQARGLSTKQLD